MHLLKNILLKRWFPVPPTERGIPPESVCVFFILMSTERIHELWAAVVSTLHPSIE